jgi:hypothetical protein
MHPLIGGNAYSRGRESEASRASDEKQAQMIRIA